MTDKSLEILIHEFERDTEDIYEFVVQSDESDKFKLNIYTQGMGFDITGKDRKEIEEAIFNKVNIVKRYNLNEQSILGGATITLVNYELVLLDNSDYGSIPRKIVKAIGNKYKEYFESKRTSINKVLIGPFNSRRLKNRERWRELRYGAEDSMYIGPEEKTAKGEEEEEE